MIALIDGDIVLHRCAGSCEPTKIKPFVEEKEVALFRMQDLVSNILKATEANEFKIFIGDGKTFRHAIYPEYKANRTRPRPTHYEFLKDILLKNYPTTLVKEIETDDRLGIEQTTYGLESIICSIDKDLLQIPGHHYNFVKQLRTFVSPSDGYRTFYRQLITGDATDNIPAFDGKLRNSIPQFVQKLLDPIDEMSDEWDMYAYVRDLHMNYSGNPSKDCGLDIMYRNAHLLYIHKKENDEWQKPQASMTNGATQDTTPSSSECYDKALEDIHQNSNV